jgi:hypothetical protein
VLAAAKPDDADPVKPAADPLKPDPVKPAADPVKPVADPVKLGADPLKLGADDPVKPAGPGPPAAGPSGAAIKPADSSSGRAAAAAGLPPPAAAACFAAPLPGGARLTGRELARRPHLGKAGRPRVPPPPGPGTEDQRKQQQEDHARDDRVPDKGAADAPVDRGAVHRRGGRRRLAGGTGRTGRLRHGFRDGRRGGECTSGVDGAEA